MSNKKVIVTGASGLIGKEVLMPLQEAGFEVYVIIRNTQIINQNGINILKGDLFYKDRLESIFKDIKPSYLLNLAWATKEDYSTSNINFDFLKAGLDLLKFFKENGGKRAIFAGTISEYAFKDTPLKETDRIEPLTVYAHCKNHLRQLAQLYCDNNNISFGWGRISYVFGINESTKRLTAHLINSFLNNKEAIINCGSLIRDYIFTKDIAEAFVKFLDSDIEGIVNVSSGNGISLADYAKLIANKLNKIQYLKILEENLNQPHIIVGDNTKLIKEVGYKIQYDCNRGIDEILKTIKKI
jgi:nucleoside-diphosphate-sugar epimerase